MVKHAKHLLWQLQARSTCFLPVPLKLLHCSPLLKTAMKSNILREDEGKHTRPDSGVDVINVVNGGDVHMYFIAPNITNCAISDTRGIEARRHVRGNVRRNAKVKVEGLNVFYFSLSTPGFIGFQSG